MSFKIQRGLFKHDLTDYHAILGISLSAEPNAIRKRYLRIAHSLHPDTCKAQNDAERQQASEVLSKLVNPAYESLKGKGRHEYQLVLAQMGKRLAKEGGSLALSSDAAKELMKANGNAVEAAYQKALKELASGQYKSIAAIEETIGQISELNLVYLMRKEGEGLAKSEPAKGKKPSGVSPAKSESPGKGKPAAASEQHPPSLIDPYIRRAQEYIAKNNYSKAVLELRDGLKIDPNDSTCHSLMGVTYLKQKQLSMAKVHIGKALKADPNNPMARKAKEALERATGGSATSSRSAAANTSKLKASSKSANSGGMFGGLFGSNSKKK